MLSAEEIPALVGTLLIIGGGAIFWGYLYGKWEGYCRGYREGRQSREQ